MSNVFSVLIAAMLGVLLSVGVSLALVSSQAPDDLEESGSILSTYGES